MERSIFLDKYPIYSIELMKNEIQQQNVAEIIAYLKEKIDAHKTAAFVAIFDNYSHTKAMDGEIHPTIKDMQQLIFCFGPAIPATKVAAVRPRTLGVSELEDHFVVDFMDAPKAKLNAIMENWVESMRQI